MKKLLILAGVVLLSGCWQNTNRAKLDVAAKICDNRGGISVVTSWFYGGVFVQCGDLSEHRVWSKALESAK